MISYLTLRIKKTQEYLWSIHGQDVAFVHVQVDHVDMKNFIDALGISISFIDPTGPELELVCAGVGLVESDTHTHTHTHLTKLLNRHYKCCILVLVSCRIASCRWV